MQHLWENQAKIQADIYKYLGFGFCSSPCLLFIDYLRHNKDFSDFTGRQVFFTFILIGVGIYFLLKAINIMRKLDEEILYAKSNS